MKAATVNAQVAAALLLRAAAFSTLEQREAARDELKLAVAPWQKLTSKATAEKAWGLGPKAAEQSKAEELGFAVWAATC